MANSNFNRNDGKIPKFAQYFGVLNLNNREMKKL